MSKQATPKNPIVRDAGGDVASDVRLSDVTALVFIATFGAGYESNKSLLRDAFSFALSFNEQRTTALRPRGGDGQ